MKDTAQSNNQNGKQSDEIWELTAEENAEVEGINLMETRKNELENLMLPKVIQELLQENNLRNSYD